MWFAVLALLFQYSLAALHQKSTVVSALNRCKYLHEMGQVVLDSETDKPWVSETNGNLAPVEVSSWGIATKREQIFWKRDNCGEMLRSTQIAKQETTCVANTDSKVYVSLTTLPSRVGNLLTVVESITAQTFPPTAILLSIPKFSDREQTEYTIPNEIRAHPLVQIIECEDQGPATKVLGALPWLLEHKGVNQDKDILVAVDDDLWYRPAALSAIVEGLEANPNSVQTGFVYDVGSLDVGQGADLMGWRIADLVSLTHFELPKECRLVDDVWFSSYARSMRLKMMVVPKLLWPHVGYLKDKPGEKNSLSDASSLHSLRGELSRPKLNAACEQRCRHGSCVKGAPGVSAGIAGLQMIARNREVWLHMLNFFQAKNPPLKVHIDDTCVDPNVVASEYTPAYLDGIHVMKPGEWEQKYAAEAFFPISLRASPYLGDASSKLRFVNVPSMFT
jgi:hypothetical protein